MLFGYPIFRGEPVAAEFWEEVFPFQGDRESTLKKLQEDVCSNGRYFRLYESFDEAVKSLSSRDFSDVPEELAEELKSVNAEKIEKYKSIGKASTIAEKIEQIKILNETESTKSALDFTGFSDKAEFRKFQYFSGERLEKLLGTDKPSIDQIKKAHLKIRALCGRSSGVCLPVHQNGTVKELYFCALSAN